MLELNKYFIDAMKADSGLNALTGGDSTDYRIYQFNPPFTITFSSIKRAAIFYRDNQNPRPTLHSYPSQRGNIYLYFSVESPNKTLTQQVAEYIINKFENKGFYTTNWRVLNVIMNGSSDGEFAGTPTTPVYKRNISFLLLNVFDRSSTYPV
jgi:hypothetical protein